MLNSGVAILPVQVVHFSSGPNYIVKVSNWKFIFGYFTGKFLWPAMPGVEDSE